MSVMHWNDFGTMSGPSSSNQHTPLDKQDGDARGDFTPAPIPLTHSSSLPLVSSSATLLPASNSSNSVSAGQSQSTRLAPLPLFRAPSHESDPGHGSASGTRRSSASSTHAATGGRGTSKRRNLLHPPSWSASRSRSRRSSPKADPAAPPSTAGSSVANATDVSATDLISPDAEYFDVISPRDLPDTFAPSRLKSLAALARINKTWTDAELQAEVERDLRKSSSPAPSMHQVTPVPSLMGRTPDGSPAMSVKRFPGSATAVHLGMPNSKPGSSGDESESEHSHHTHSSAHLTDQLHAHKDEDVEIGTSPPVGYIPPSAGERDDDGGGDDKDDDDMDPDIAAELESISDRNRLLRKHLTLKRELAQVTEIRRDMFLFLEAPSTRASKTYAAVHFLIVLVSVVLVCVETSPEFYDEQPAWKSYDLVVCIYFTLDLLARIYAVPNRLKYLTRVLTLLDIATLVPYWLDAIGVTNTDNSLFVMRILRIGRIFQLFRHMRQSPLINITVQSVERSKEAFGLVLLYSMLGILVTSSLMHMIERGRWDPQKRMWMRLGADGVQEEPSPFQSIPDGFYWAVVTITTTGYGDVLPRTNAGKCIAGFTMIIGVSIIALPVSIIGSHFMAEWIEYQRLRLKSKAQPLGTALDAHGNPLAAAAHAHMHNAPGLSKRQRIQQLQDQHDAMVTLVQQAQDALNDIAPTETYARYMRMKDKYHVAVARAKELQTKVDELEEKVKDLKRVVGSGGGPVPFTRTLSRTTTWIRDWANATEQPPTERPPSAGKKLFGGLFRPTSSQDVHERPAQSSSSLPMRYRTMSLPVGNPNTTAGGGGRRKRLLSNLFTNKRPKTKSSPHSASSVENAPGARPNSADSNDNDHMVITGSHGAPKRITTLQIRRVDTAPVLLNSSSAPASALGAPPFATPPWLRDMPASSNQLTVGSTATAPSGGWGRVQFPDYERPSLVGSPIEMSPVTSVVGHETGPSPLREELDGVRGVHVMTTMTEEQDSAAAAAVVPMSPTLVDPWAAGGEGNHASGEADEQQQQQYHDRSTE